MCVAIANQNIENLPSDQQVRVGQGIRGPTVDHVLTVDQAGSALSLILSPRRHSKRLAKILLVKPDPLFPVRTPIISFHQEIALSPDFDQRGGRGGQAKRLRETALNPLVLGEILEA